MKKLSIVLLTFILFQGAAKSSFAVSEPPVFSCQEPVGTIIADWPNGNHGIAGDSGTYTGSDRVYQIDSNHVVQCFCPDTSATGIQSNWAKLEDTSEENIAYFQKLGWTYVPNGLAWGLEDSAYIVKNQTYTCASGMGGGNENNSSSNSSSSNSNNSSSSNSNSGTSTSNSQGQILGASTLAYTGNDRAIMLYGFLGLLFAYLAYKFAQE